MPLTKVDYSKTIIYKIQHRDIDELLYVGSTTDFTRRKAEHKRCCNNANANVKQHNFKVYKMIRDNGGFSCFNMTIIKEFPCQNKQEAFAEEDRCIREMKSSLNMMRAYLTPEEKLENHKQYNQLYKEQHREEIREQSRDYAKKYAKKYREAYRETINEKNKQKVSCLCGGKYTLCHKSRHFKTKKHQDFVNTTEQ